MQCDDYCVASTPLGGDPRNVLWSAAHEMKNEAVKR